MRTKKYYLSNLLVFLFFTGLFFFLPFLNQNLYVNAVEDCSFTMDGDLEWIDKENNTFYYNKDYDKSGIKFTFKIDDPDWWKGKADFDSQNIRFIVDRGIAFGDKIKPSFISRDFTAYEYTNDNNLRLDDLGDTGYSVKLIAVDSNDNAKDTLCIGEYRILPKLSCKVEVSADTDEQNIFSNWSAKISEIEIKSTQYYKDSIRFQSDIKNLSDVPKKCDKNTTSCTWYTKFPSSGYTPTGFIADLGQIDEGNYYLNVMTFSVLWAPEQIICSDNFHVYPQDSAICNQSPCKITVPGGTSFNCTISECQECSWCRLHPTSTPTPTPRPPDPAVCSTTTCVPPGGGPPYFCAKSECASCSFCSSVIPPPGSSTPIPPVPSLAPICEQIDPKYETNCKDCVDRDHGIWTAIGCVPTDLELILKNYIFVYGVGIAGSIAFLYFLYGVFLILTSAGNAEKIAEGKEIIISALSGLFLIIFSVFLLRVIGYDILKIPGFG